MRTALFCFVFFGTTCGAAQQTGDNLIRQAREVLAKKPADGRGEAEALLRDARKVSAGKADVYSEASIWLALVLLGGARPAGEIADLVNEVLPFYERSQDAKLALALEIKAAVAGSDEADALKKRAAAIRTAIIRDLTQQSDAPAATTEGPFRVADTTTAPRVLEKPEPPYSEAARIGKHQGAVLLALIIDTSGRTRDVRLVRSLGFDLDEAAWQTVKKWRFDPAIRNGQPVRVVANVEINFRLL